jgi:hypothetical protein
MQFSIRQIAEGFTAIEIAPGKSVDCQQGIFGLT